MSALTLGTVWPVATAHAQTASASADMEPARVSEPGQSTTAWLDLQRSNAQAAPIQPMLGAEATAAYRRYMDSFNAKIPATYGSALTKSNTGGSSGGSAN